MVGEITLLSEWIPEQMGPGALFILELNDDDEIRGDPENPYWAVLACPECGMLGLITRKQIAGLIPIMCGSDTCSCQFFLNNEDLVPRKPS